MTSLASKEFYVHRREVTAWELDADGAGFARIYENIDNRRKTYNALLPDEFWCYACNTAPDCYSVGFDDEANVPREIMGIPVYPMFRGGKTTYHGPGQLAIVAIIDARRLRYAAAGRLADHINESLYTSIIDHAQDQFGRTLHYRTEDPGLYDNQGAKIASTGFDVYQGFFIHHYSINYSVDLNKYLPIAVCGVRGRIMSNLVTEQPLNDAQTFEHAQDLLPRIWQRLYLDADVQEYPTETLENPRPIR